MTSAIDRYFAAADAAAEAWRPKRTTSTQECVALDAIAERLKEEALASGEPHPYDVSDRIDSDTVLRAESMKQALEMAEEWIREGDCDRDGTVHVYVIDLLTNEQDSLTVTIEPDERREWLSLAPTEAER